MRALDSRCLSGVLTGEQLVSLSIDAAEQLEAAMGNKVWFQKEVGNPVVQCLGERLSKELLENDQYIGNVRVVFDSLMFQVLTFCRSRLDASRRKLGSRGEYRFHPDAVEWDLQLDLNEYLSGNLVGEIGTELSDIATGRADICVVSVRSSLLSNSRRRSMTAVKRGSINTWGRRSHIKSRICGLGSSAFWISPVGQALHLTSRKAFG